MPSRRRSGAARATARARAQVAGAVRSARARRHRRARAYAGVVDEPLPKQLLDLLATDTRAADNVVPLAARQPRSAAFLRGADGIGRKHCARDRRSARHSCSAPGRQGTTRSSSRRGRCRCAGRAVRRARARPQRRVARAVRRRDGDSGADVRHGGRRPLPRGGAREHARHDADAGLPARRRLANRARELRRRHRARRRLSAGIGPVAGDRRRDRRADRRCAARSRSRTRAHESWLGALAPR